MTTIINRRAAWLGPVRAFHGRIVSGVPLSGGDLVVTMRVIGGGVVLAPLREFVVLCGVCPSCRSLADYADCARPLKGEDVAAINGGGYV
jgi:hypothetical protein